jgi:hypothetical protein
MLRQIAHVLAALALPVALAASPAAAQPIPGLVLATCETSVDAAQEAADQALVEQIIGELNNGGCAALARRAPALREIMGRAPACYPRIERRSDQIIVHTSDAGEFMVLSAVLGGDAAQGGQGLPIVMRQNTYPLAAFLLGSDANEARRPEEALAWLDRGLAMQPEDSLLILERVAS